MSTVDTDSGDRTTTGTRTPFRALRVVNFRRYLAGQAISLVGLWMQAVALPWLVLQLTGSGTMLGLVVALRFLPLLLAGPYGGLLADRSDKRRLLLTTQSALACLSLLLGVLIVTDAVRLWTVLLHALLSGIVTAVDNPARQALLPELVNPALLTNAVSLYSVTNSTARAVGPAVAGVLIAATGVGPCFLVNAATSVAVLFSLATLRTDRMVTPPAVKRARGQLTEGLRHVRGRPGLWVPLAMMALIGTLAYEFQVVLPLLATAYGDARTLGLMTSAMGVGAVVGGLLVAAYGRPGIVPLAAAAAVFAVSLAVAAIVSPLPALLACLACVGCCGTVFLATGNTTLHLITEPRFRGRVMSLWSAALLGSTPVGGPVVGTLIQHYGPRSGLVCGAAACAAASALALLALPRVPLPHRHL